MAFDFPSSPTVGQQFTPVAGVTYTYNGYGWVLAGGIVEAPSDGTLYGRVNAAWVRGVKLAGDTMTGQLKVPNLQATAPSFGLGTISSGSVNIDPANGNIQHYTNGGAHTIAAAANPFGYTMIVECVNAASGAGAITFGFTILDGDSFTTNANRKHLFYITRTNTVSRCTVVYVTGS